MNESLQSRHIVRFGVFEVDLASAELRKRGLKIRLSGQPFEVLATLLERPGEIVTREELQKKLWPDGTFVDFDHSLNTAVNKIREALGDSAENPRFVETLARRGYRFIAPVEVTSSGTAGPWDSASQGPNLASSSPPTTVTPRKDVRARPWRGRKWAALLVLTAVFLITAIAVRLWWSSRHVPEARDQLKLTRLTFDSGLTTDAVISPDGKLVAYASDRSGRGNLDIWLKQISGGDPICLTQNPADDHQPDFSPDGNQIVFRSEREGGGIYLMSTLGGQGQERLLASLGRNPRFSPDGALIAYWTGHVASRPLGAQAGDGGLFVVISTAGPPRKVETGFRVSGSPIWSPDGQYLLFYGHPTSLYPLSDSSSDWWVVSKEGGSPVKTGAFDVLGGQQIERILPAPVPLANQWTDSRIFFSARRGDSVNLWKVSITPRTWQVTGPVQQLTTGSALETRPSAARDGTLVFSSLVDNGDIWSLPMAADQGKVTGELKQITHEETAEYQPSISADGKLLVFAAERFGNRSILLKDLENGKETALTVTQAPKLPSHPEISADGTLVAYFDLRTIWVVTARGREVGKVCDGYGFAWDWTPDNKRLSFNRRWSSPGDNPKDKGTIHLRDLHSRKETLLLEHSVSSLYQANFSPDGRWVAFQGDQQTARLFIGPYRGDQPIPESEWISLSDGSSWDDKPRWSPDGICFTSFPTAMVSSAFGRSA